MVSSLPSRPSNSPATARNPVLAVPRELWDIITRYRFLPEVIYGESEIVAFHEELKAMPPDAPRAKHLFLGLIPDGDAEGARKTCDSVLQGWVQGFEETDDQRAERTRQNSHLSKFGKQPRQGPQYNRFVQRDVVGGIMSYHKDSLESLTYLVVASYINFGIFGYLPNLKDLTIVCLRSDYPYYRTYFDDQKRRQAQFPSLKRLHLSYFDTRDNFHYDEFRCLAPNLTHLRLSGRKIYPEFEKLLPHTKVFMQPMLVSSEEQQAQVSRIRDILAVKQYRERTTLLESGHGEEGRYGFFDALLDWLDVSAGGNAFWDVAAERTITIDELAAR